MKFKQWFLRYNAKSTSDERKKTDILHYIKTVNTCAANYTIKKAEIKSTECKKMHEIANKISDKGLVSRIYFKMCTSPLKRQAR